MQNIKKYSIVAILTLSILEGIFNNVPSYAQECNETHTTATEEKHTNEGSTQHT
jgi:hypothetical protein